MKTEFACKEGCRYGLKVEFTAEEVAAEREKVVVEYRKYARVDGFRPGKAPVAMLQKKYGKAIDQAVAESLLPQGYQAAKKEKGFQALAEMNLEKGELKAGEGWSFTMEMDIRPKIELPAYKGIALEAKKVEIQAEAVEEQVKGLLAMEGTFEVVEGEATVEAGDMAQVDFTGTVEGKPVTEVAPTAKGLGEAKDFWVMTTEEYSFLPGFGPALQGMKTGDAKAITVQMGEDCRVAELKGKTVEFQTTLKAVKRRKPAELDEKLLKRFGVKDEAELREELKKNLEARAKSDRLQALLEELRKFLLSGASFDLPKSLVSRAESRLVYDTVLKNSQRGVGDEEIKGHFEEIQKQCHERAEGDVKYGLMLDAIAEAEGIEASRAEALAQVQRETGDAKKALKRAATENRCGEEDILEDVQESLKRAKVRRWLLQNAAWTGDGAEQIALELKDE